MKYERIYKGFFCERPNRFIALISIDGVIETVHVKNTGRCAELLIPGTVVYVQKAGNEDRKTQWDLIAVQKGSRIVNMDSQITNYVVKEWIGAGHLITDLEFIKGEVPYGDSRLDLYVEGDQKKIFIEVKGVTLEENDMVRFPDAPSERAIKHLQELEKAVKAGYDAYVFFVVQMEGVRYFTPNKDTHPAFAEALLHAQQMGVKVIAYECLVEADSIVIHKEVPVVLEQPTLYEMRMPLVEWYQQNKRDLPWRKQVNAYGVWVSEIMLQQTRVEAVKPYYARFMEALPDIEALATVEEEKLLKLWEGLGYYNRVRNMQIAAKQIMEEYNGVFPDKYEEILKLKGIGSYTAGAISAFAFHKPKPAVDGNVLRVISRLLVDEEDIMKASMKKRIERYLAEIIPTLHASDFNQGLIELGAIICVPNGVAKCEICPIATWCEARKQDRVSELPVKSKLKARKIEKKTILIFKDGENIAIKKRPKKGLLAGLYELPNVESWYSKEEIIQYAKEIGLAPIRVIERGTSKHIFSHIEWHMIGYEIQVDELEKSCKEKMIFAKPQEIQEFYSIPSAFEAYTEYMDIRLGQDAFS